MEKSKIFDQEGIHTITEENNLVAIVRRDPVSKKHLVYIVREAASDEIVTLMKRPGDNVVEKPKKEKE